MFYVIMTFVCAIVSIVISVCSIPTGNFIGFGWSLILTYVAYCFYRRYKLELKRYQEMMRRRRNN